MSTVDSILNIVVLYIRLSTMLIEITTDKYKKLLYIYMYYFNYVYICTYINS